MIKRITQKQYIALVLITISVFWALLIYPSNVSFFIKDRIVRLGFSASYHQEQLLVKLGAFLFFIASNTLLYLRKHNFSFLKKIDIFLANLLFIILILLSVINEQYLPLLTLYFFLFIQFFIAFFIQRTSVRLVLLAAIVLSFFITAGLTLGDKGYVL